MGSPFQLAGRDDRCEGRETTITCHATCSASASTAVGEGYLSHWELVPEELVAKILALLPFSSIYLGRAVCRRWRSIIWSPLFLSFCKLRPLRMPWLLEFQQHMYNQSWAYDLEGCQWFHLSFFFLPETATIVATSGGLVCLGRVSEEGYMMFVCNPLTKDWKRLPSIPIQPDLVLMDVDHESNSYKVIGLVFRAHVGAGYSRSVLVFDGKTGYWRETLHVPEGLCGENLWDATVSGGVLYCLSTNQRMEAYDLNRGVWSPSPYPTDALARILQVQRLCYGQQQDSNSGLDDSYLLDRRGRLAMVTPHRGIKHVYINKFDAISRTWRSSHVSAVKGTVICAGRFASLCVTKPQTGSDVYLLHSKGNGHYRSASKSFLQLPRSPLTRHKVHREEILVRGLWFEPRLDATT